MPLPELPDYPAASVEFFDGVNSESYDADTNPKGFADGGHIVLFPEFAVALSIVSAYFHELAAGVYDLAEMAADSAESAEAGSGTEASVAEILAGLAAHYLSIRRVYAANVPVALTDGATINWDMATGINVKVTLGAAGRTLANPTNKVAGKSGILRVIQGAGGGGTITSYGSDYIWIGGEPAWPTTPGARSLIPYFVGDDGKVELTFAGSSA